MTAKRKPNADFAAIDQAVLDELFPDSNDSPGQCFRELESAPLGRLAAAVTALGGMVTFYRDRSNNTDSINCRFGERKISLQLEPGVDNATYIEQLVNRYEHAVAKMNAAKNKP